MSSAIPFGRPWITDDDRKAVLEALDSPILTHGPQGKAFEDEFARFAGGGHAVSVSSCTAALHMAYLALGVGPGDEVLVPAQTHTATAHAVELVGARPVFVDCDPRTGNVTPKALAAAVTPRTRALSVVHFAGIPCDMEGIVEVGRAHGLKVVEDCALALGTRRAGVHAGLFGDVGCFSFYPVKHITTGDGGMFLTRDADLAHRAERLRAFGVDRSHGERRAPGMYDVPTLGLNYRLSDLQAALGRSQLRRVRENLQRRAANFATVAGALGDLAHVQVLDALAPGDESSHYCLSLVLDGPLASRRDEIVSRLNGAGVGTSVYYPHPVPRLAYYRGKYGYDPAQYPQAERLSDHSIALPVGPHLGPMEASFVGTTAASILQEAMS